MRSKMELEVARKMRELCSTPGHAYVGVRKFFNGIDWEIPWDTFKDFTMPATEIGYAGWDSKYKQLDRNYWNQEEFDKIRDQLRARITKPQTCVTARFGNQAKKKDSMGFCIQTISLNYIKKTYSNNPNFIVEVHYRSTEGLKKLTADIHYLANKVIPYLTEGLGVEPDIIRLRFCTMYICPIFSPVLMNLINPIELVESIKEGDFYWYDRAISQKLSLWLADDIPRTWAQQTSQWENFQANVLPRLTRPEIRKLKNLSRESRR